MQSRRHTTVPLGAPCPQALAAAVGTQRRTVRPYALTVRHVLHMLTPRRQVAGALAAALTRCSAPRRQHAKSQAASQECRTAALQALTLAVLLAKKLCTFHELHVPGVTMVVQPLLARSMH